MTVQTRSEPMIPIGMSSSDLRFLGCRRDRFEADVGEEDDRGSAEDSAPAELALLACRLRDERLPVRREGVVVLHDQEAADDDKGDQHRHLDGDDEVVDLRGFRHADDKQKRQQEADQEGRQVEDGRDGGAVRQLLRVAGRPGERGRHMYPHVGKQADDVSRPADRDHRRGEAVFEEQERAHDPGRELADGRIAVGVGGA